MNARPLPVAIPSRLMRGTRYLFLYRILEGSVRSIVDQDPNRRGVKVVVLPALNAIPTSQQTGPTQEDR
jgi:hypothetical protein